MTTTMTDAELETLFADPVAQKLLHAPTPARFASSTPTEEMTSARKRTTREAAVRRRTSVFWRMNGRLGRL